jgi:hypothetical protein
MNENGKMYALSALKKRLARIAGQIFALKKQIGAKLGQLAHPDATLVLFDPETHPNSIRPKRVAAYQRAPLFSHGARPGDPGRAPGGEGRATGRQ